MSQENVEVARRFVEAYSRSDMLRVTGDGLRPTSMSLMPTTTRCGSFRRHGHATASRRSPISWPATRDAWDRYEFVVKKLIAVGDDRVLVHVAITAEGRESGVKLDGDLYQCVWVRHGHFFRWEDHLSLKGALRGLGLNGETLEAAGLRE